MSTARFTAAMLDRIAARYLRGQRSAEPTAQTLNRTPRLLWREDVRGAVITIDAVDDPTLPTGVPLPMLYPHRQQWWQMAVRVDPMRPVLAQVVDLHREMLAHLTKDVT